MAMITYPLNNIDYSAADAGLFHCTRKSGVWAEDSFPISASGSDNSITIGSGVAWISNDKYWGKVVAQKEEVTLDLGIADSVYNRIDAVVIQFNSNANATNIVVKKGTPATRPSMPEIVQNESIFELCLCKVLRPAGSSVVTFANIADTRLDPALCGLMADSVTKVDTAAINKQIMALIDELQNELNAIKALSGVMLKNEWTDGNAVAIARGGTGATTPEEALANLGGISKTLLWENPDTSSIFPSQAVHIDIEDYDFIGVLYQFTNSNPYAFVPMEIVPNIQNRDIHNATFSSGLEFVRGFYLKKDNGIVEFKDCIVHRAFGTSSTEKANTYLIPYRIYGIKGAQ